MAEAFDPSAPLDRVQDPLGQRATPQQDQMADIRPGPMTVSPSKPVRLADHQQRRKSLMHVAAEKYIDDLQRASQILAAQAKEPTSCFRVGDPNQGGVAFTGETAQEILLSVASYLLRLEALAREELKTALSNTPEST